MQALGANGLCQVANNVALRPHFRRRPIRKIGVVHGKPVMVLGDGHHVARARLLEKPRPVGRVSPLRFELRNEIVIAEFILRAETLNVLFERRVLLLIHVAWIPLVLRTRDREHAPVNEDSKLRVPVPLRYFKFAQRFPIGAVRASGVLTVHFAQYLCALVVVFRN